MLKRSDYLQSASFYGHATLVDWQTCQPVPGIPFKDGICAPLIGDLNVFMQGVTWNYTDAAGNKTKGLKWVLPYGDLSVRREGRYRLQIDVFELVDGISEHRGRICTDPFYTFTPKDFPGMGDATETTVHLSTMGIRLRANKTQHMVGMQIKRRTTVRSPKSAVTHDLLGWLKSYGISNCPTWSQDCRRSFRTDPSFFHRDPNYGRARARSWTRRPKRPWFTTVFSNIMSLACSLQPQICFRIPHPLNLVQIFQCLIL